MTLKDIKKAVDEGKDVHWGNLSYIVIKDGIGQYLIKCKLNNSIIGLDYDNGEKMNGKEDEFFIRGDPKS
jgi:hypothetical protein